MRKKCEVCNFRKKNVRMHYKEMTCVHCAFFNSMGTMNAYAEEQLIGSLKKWMKRYGLDKIE